MQTELHFPTADKKTIEVLVNSAKGNRSAVLIVYGLCGDTNQSFFYNASNLFPKKGVDVWRIRLYGWHPGARSMLNTTWKQMMGDIHQVLGVMAKRYKNVSMIGHSMGGTQTVYVDHPALKSKIFWDPSYIYSEKSNNNYRAGKTKNPFHKNYYTLDWGTVLLVPKKLINEFYDLCWYAKNVKKFPKKQPPMLVMRASNSGWAQDILPAKLVKIEDADHCFNRREGQNQKELFRHTLNFIKKHA